MARRKLYPQPIPPPATPGGMLAIPDVAALLDVSEKTVRQMALSGELRFIRVGRRGMIRFRPEWIQHFIEAQATR